MQQTQQTPEHLTGESLAWATLDELLDHCDHLEDENAALRQRLADLDAA